MSIPIELRDLAAAMQGYGLAYLLTDGDPGAPHVVAVQVRLQGNELHIQDAGRRTRANAQRQPAVAMLWPPAQAGQYSLIVDGTASVSEDRLRITPTRAVLHQSSPASQAGQPDSACPSDCIELPLKS